MVSQWALRVLIPRPPPCKRLGRPREHAVQRLDVARDLRKRLPSLAVSSPRFSTSRGLVADLSDARDVGVGRFGDASKNSCSRTGRATLDPTQVFLADGSVRRAKPVRPSSSCNATMCIAMSCALTKSALSAPACPPLAARAPGNDIALCDLERCWRRSFGPGTSRTRARIPVLSAVITDAIAFSVSAGTAPAIPSGTPAPPFRAASAVPTSG